MFPRRLRFRHLRFCGLAPRPLCEDQLLIFTLFLFLRDLQSRELRETRHHLIYIGRVDVGIGAEHLSKHFFAADSLPLGALEFLGIHNGLPRAQLHRALIGALILLLFVGHVICRLEVNG